MWPFSKANVEEKPQQRYDILFRAVNGSEIEWDIAVEKSQALRIAGYRMADGYVYAEDSMGWVVHTPIDAYKLRECN